VKDLIHKFLITDQGDIDNADQDHADGAALRRLREALPEGWLWTVGPDEFGQPVPVIVVAGPVDLDDYPEYPDGWPYIGFGTTLAEACDKCREALGGGDLLPALAAELLYAIAGGGRAVRKCSASDCPRWEACSTTTPASRPFYCSAHGRTKAGRSRAAVNEAARRYRARNKADPGRTTQKRGTAGRAD
jgi:hypothetical protein